MSWKRPETAEEREARLYEETQGRPPPDPVDDWQLNYRGTKEERARLRAWMGVENEDELGRGPQPEQDEVLF